MSDSNQPRDCEQDASSDPNVFQCRRCGKVFEARTGRAFCPECDSGDVERLTD